MPPLLKLVIISFILDLLGLDYCKNLEHSVGFRINQIKFWVLSSTLWLCWGRWGMGDSQGTGLWVLNCINFWPELTGQCCQHVYYYSTLRISTVLLRKTGLWRGVFLVLTFVSRGCTESNSWKCNVTFLAMNWSLLERLPKCCLRQQLARVTGWAPQVRIKDQKRVWHLPRTPDGVAYADCAAGTSSGTCSVVNMLDLCNVCPVHCQLVQNLDRRVFFVTQARSYQTSSSGWIKLLSQLSAL